MYCTKYYLIMDLLLNMFKCMEVPHSPIKKIEVFKLTNPSMCGHFPHICIEVKFPLVKFRSRFKYYAINC